MIYSNYFQINNSDSIKIRKSCKDIWNAFMINDAKFCSNSDMPICRNTTKAVPQKLIAYDEAKTIHNKNKESGCSNYYIDAFIHFYIDDYKFDGKRSSIWLYPENALEIIKHFSGIITPDFSTYLDFPDPIKRWNTYRMRTFGCWISSHSINVINNVRWGTKETFVYCFDGIPKNSIVSIGSVASGLKNRINQEIFIEGFYKMIDIIQPKHILIYGSLPSHFIRGFKENDINPIFFKSKTNEVFERKKNNEQS